MGGGHEHHEPFKVPDYKIYSNYRDFPQLAIYEKRLERLGLKDPWIRNYVFLFDKGFDNVKGIPRTTWNLWKIGLKPGFIAAVTVIAIEEIYSKVKYGYTSWDSNSQLPSNWLVKDISEIFSLSNTKKHDSDARSLFPPYGLNKDFNVLTKKEVSKAENPWGDLAKNVIRIFKSSADVSPLTTSTEAPIFHLIPSVQELMPRWLRNQNTHLNIDGNKINLLNKDQNSLFGKWTQMLNSQQPLAQIDTGESALNKLVIRENFGPDDLFSRLMGGNFKERGWEWNDGNLRLVNKNGNQLLGSELAVNDRSIDIPIQKWFDLASNFIRTYKNLIVS